MPDLKFDGNFYFSANSKSKGHPLLVPVISNPDFATSKSNPIPGILELVNGDLGITEKIMTPILSPIITQITGNPLMVESIINVNGLEKNVDVLKNFLVKQYIPKDLGIKPLEKTIISSMMDSHKPLMDFLKVFLQTLGVAEDIVCRYLGSYIKVLGKEIGIKSRSPYYWDESLGYTETITHALKEMIEASDKANSIMENSMSDKNPIKNNISNTPKDKVDGDTDLPAYYVGYFDENGNSVEPPLWIKNSNKWFSKTIQDRNGDSVTIGAPFQQLSDDLNEGVLQLKQRQYNQLLSLQQEKSDMLKNIEDRLKDAEKITDSNTKNNEIKSLELEKIESSKVMDDLIQAIQDVIDGTNKSGNNYIDDNDISKGINPPAIINEWVAKTKASQLRSKYYPQQKNTIQSLINNKGEAIEPYVSIPKFGVNFEGNYYNIEVPLAFDNQISTSKNYSKDVFYEKKQSEKENGVKKYFSNVNNVKSLDLNPNKEKYPFIDNNITHFSNDIKQEYIPDSIKRFYLPIEWEEVLEYDIISKKTGKILKVEKEFVSFKIDVENDYELRVIKVINLPLLSGATNNPVDNFFPDKNGELILNIKNDYIQFLKTDKNVKKYDITINSKDSKTINSNQFNHGLIYVDENVFLKDNYFYLRKDTKWGNDYIDNDDSEIYQVKDIIKNWINIKVNNCIIDDVLKTITFDSSVKIPTNIVEYIYGNNFIINSINNNKIGVKITSLVDINDKLILKYDGSLISENISSSDISFDYLESSYVETYQYFTSSSTFSASIYTITDINYLPEIIKNGCKSIIIQGFDNNSLLSTLSERIKKEGNDTTQFIKPNSEADNIYNITKIEKVKTRKGVNILSLKLDFPIPSKFNNKSYSSDTTSDFYYPLRIYTVPQANNQASGISNSSGIVLGTGTLYTINNNIPPKLNIENPNTTLHSPLDINEQNLLKEGIVYQGLDPRFVDRNKWKVFYLVEAIKKDNDNIASINGNINPLEAKQKKNLKGTDGGGKEWYGLIDKFTALPMIISKLVPLISAKIIPLAIKIIQLISNPKKIKDLLLDIGLMNEDISKFPKNFTAFSQKGFLNKAKNISKKKVSKNFNNYKRNKSEDIGLYYDGPQIGATNPSPIFILDGQALAEFGKGIFDKPLFSFGAELKNGELKSISSLKKNSNINKTPETRDEPIFSMILNFIKLPFEVIFKIFKWIIDWIKKLLNPTKIASAIKEFLSFKWLTEILGKDSIFKILGLFDISNIKDKIDEYVKSISNSKTQEMFNDVLKTIRGNDLNFVEVFVYDILKNGVKIKQEIVETPYTGNNLSSNQNIKNSNNTDMTLSDINNALNMNNSNKFNFCGDRIFSIAKLLPIPIFNTDVAYNICESPILLLKPLEIIESILKFIQEILNGFLSMPISLLGLEPTISIPKFGKEIPFANIITEIIEKLKAIIKQTQVG